MPDLTLIAEILLVALCLAGGGILKGATGAGAPLLAVPAIAAMFDVRLAVMVMLVPNLLTNLWQAWRYRAALPGRALMLPLMGGGVAGILLGTWALRDLPMTLLPLAVAVAVAGYIGLRLARPGWGLTPGQGIRFAFPAGLAAGVLQGATGISAPVSITFLSALRLGRVPFMAGISLFFCTFTAVQIPAFWAGGLMTGMGLLASACALLPIMLAMPLGARLARRISPATFERVLLVLLGTLSAKLAFDALFSLAG
ncbi:sulfite exporter TauE/SafE family protein [Paroceanicella profunda]|uniref:Probable membrane transporter protein n=1 Tax=Paroceanicella profunda TaxID=2579971 RepID=A0A5B8FW65_9RHOB|nr:sulfite exporter TauE/SafE family protein [Paroceanicella profunda]QDL92695.1 sulfite exporter TauE/SafE family protein [Paroceanicella profunda]